jgi:hypothetical protein
VSYWVRVSNACNQADSATATITVGSTPAYVVWVPVASHTSGLNQSQWVSDLGLLDVGGSVAHVQGTFFGSDGVVTNTTTVAAGAQSILSDVVGQLGGSGSGPIQIISDQPLKVTARTYNRVGSGATCYPNGTQGQDYPAVVASDGLAAGQSAYLAGLAENAPNRCNVGLVNAGSVDATVLVELFDGTGRSLTDYTVSLSAGQWAQETQPFKNRAGQTAMDGGYANITVLSGSGVFGFASVISNITNDPTTIAMQSAASFLQQGSKLVGTGATGPHAANQGYSVAISADGNTAIIGGFNDNSGSGAAWVFTRNGGIWSQQGAKLTGAGGDFSEQGFSVAIAADGNTAIIGGFQDHSNTGAAWVFARNGGVWSQQGNRLVGTGAIGGAQQGRSVAISADGNTVVVGGAFDNSELGAAWVYTRSGGVWSQQGSKLVGTGVSGSAWQGCSVAMSADGNTIIVGGLFDNSQVGAAWVFTRSGGVWSQQGSKLVGTGSEGGAGQGVSVAISGDGNTAIVGGEWDDGAGAAWVFTRSGGVWSQQGGKLVGTGVLGSASQGLSVALSADGNLALVGGPLDNSGAGAAWVFERSQGVWSQEAGRLVGKGAAGPSSARQGFSVAMSADGTTAIVGGPYDDSGRGAAWVFSTPTGVAWVPVASHTSGLNNSQWRSDLGLLNAGKMAANVQITFFGSGGAVEITTTVAAGAQSVLTDVVGVLGGSGSGAIAVQSDQLLEVTTRTYNQVSPDAACYPNGTQGQDYPVVVASDGLVAGQSAYLAGLTENASYHSNIGVVNTGTEAASVLVELFDAVGIKLTDYTVPLAPGQWTQETQPFKNRAGQTAMDRAFATITVQSGSGVFGFASVISNITNDPTTVSMER